MYLQCLDALHRVERAVRQRLDVVVVQRQQTEAVQVAERVLADARDLVGVQQQQLQRRQAAEHVGGQVFDLVAVQDAGDNYEMIIMYYVLGVM